MSLGEIQKRGCPGELLWIHGNGIIKIMYEDRRYQLISYHDTWVSVDPVFGCPYECVYCVLRHSETVGIRPQKTVSAKECVLALKRYPFLIDGFTPVAIGNETDMFHSLNQDYLLQLLAEIRNSEIKNPLILVTKGPLTEQVLKRIRGIGELKLLFFLSYSGLPRHFEPNFAQETLQRNFELTKTYGFSTIHYWRPLLPDNTTPQAIREMLSFSSSNADAVVFTGLKLHPKLTRSIMQGTAMSIPAELQDKTGEWLSHEVVDSIYHVAGEICPGFSIYRHSSCALARVLQRANHTATIYRDDVCPRSQCPPIQRRICEASRRVPHERQIVQVLAQLGRAIDFAFEDDKLVLKADITQEEFAFLLHSLNYPIEARSVRMQNLYYGDILKNQNVIPPVHTPDG
jgi:DNA repair photolyase